MSAGSFIQWLALALCVIFAATRLPDALRGKGRSIFAVLVLVCVAVGLSLAPSYLSRRRSVRNRSANFLANEHRRD